jgi:ATP-dependent helicase HrpB
MHSPRYLQHNGSRASRIPAGGGKKIVLLVPRRVVAKATARRMADLLGEEVGQTVGFRVRNERAIGPKTRIEVGR